MTAVKDSATGGEGGKLRMVMIFGHDDGDHRDGDHHAESADDDDNDT